MPRKKRKVLQHLKSRWWTNKQYGSFPAFEELVVEARQKFLETFGCYPKISCYAPGRVNLLGEHIDYNDGYGLPIALPMVTVTLGGNNASSCADILTMCESVDDPKRVNFELNDLDPGTPKWLNYLKGIIFYFGAPIPGFNAVINSSVPKGSGLSSSAALELSMLVFLEELTGRYLNNVLLKATLAVKAEHTHGGTPCGIMDQIVSLNGTRGNALLIDFQKLSWMQIPCQLQNLVFLICNSNKSHALSDGAFAERRKQCELALNIVGKGSYRNVDLNDLKVLLNVKEEILYKRAKHVITEIRRTYDCASALKAQDFVKMGQLMKEAHFSYRGDFETSCEEIDFLVDLANNFPGVLGSRMTGGGFGGCTVTIVRAGCVHQLIAKMREAYMKKYGIKADFYITVPSDGARAFNLMSIGV